MTAACRTWGGPLAEQDSERVVAAESLLPYSQSRENDTLNVNISASGIAFSCHQALQAGDYIWVRILLLSSMTAVMTCCKVVYCRPGNPYETDHYPYMVGASFVNLTAEDKQLLIRHVGRRRAQRWLMNGLLATLLMVMAAMPEEVLALLADLSEILFELLLEAVDIFRDYLAYVLEYVIQRWVASDNHTIQIISFYVQSGIEIILLYGLIRVSVKAVKCTWRKSLAWFHRKQASLAYFWRQRPWFEKAGIVLFAMTLLGGYLLVAL